MSPIYHTRTLSRLYFMSTATLPVTVCLASAADVALGTSDGANNSNAASGIGTSRAGRAVGTNGTVCNFYG